jgi:hypothetical protein
VIRHNSSIALGLADHSSHVRVSIRISASTSAGSSTSAST